MASVRGVGGVFFKSKDPTALGRWYNQHLGIPIEQIPRRPDSQSPVFSFLFLSSPAWRFC